MRLKVSFDEYLLTVCALYTGPELVFTGHRPSPEELLHDDHALTRLSGFLVTKYADKVTQEKVQGGQQIRMTFQH
jgi:xanthine permease XanP